MRDADRERNNAGPEASGGAAVRPSAGLRAVRLADRIIDYMLLVVFAIAIFIGAYYTYDAWHIYHSANDTSLLKYKPDSPEDLMNSGELSEDVVAWLTVDDTGIDYPVMQGRTNETYLNKDPYGKFSLAGSIFLDYRNAGDFSDPYSLLYGHHMNHGYMFGQLDTFLEPDYLAAHRSGTLTTRAGQTYRLQIFAAMDVPTEVDEIFAPNEGYDTLAYLRENADPALFSEPATEHILAMSTCKTPDSIDRYVVFACMQEE